MTQHIRENSREPPTCRPSAELPVAASWWTHPLCTHTSAADQFLSFYYTEGTTKPRETLVNRYDDATLRSYTLSMVLADESGCKEGAR